MSKYRIFRFPNNRLDECESVSTVEAPTAASALGRVLSVAYLDVYGLSVPNEREAYTVRPGIDGFRYGAILDD